MLPLRIQKLVNDQKHNSKEKLLNIKYMFMRDLHQPIRDINNMKIPEVIAYLERLEEDAKKSDPKTPGKKTKTMG